MEQTGFLRGFTLICLFGFPVFLECGQDSSKAAVGFLASGLEDATTLGKMNV